MLDAAIEHMRSKREEILALFANSAELDKQGKHFAKVYIESFFDILDNPRRLQNEVYGRCRGQHLIDEVLEKSTDLN